MGPVSPIGQLLFILVLLSGRLGLKKGVDAASEYQIINEGELLEFNCSSKTRMIFVYPHNLTSINTSVVIISQRTNENGIYVYDFQRPEAISGDTGWYGCADEDVGFPKNSDIGHAPNFNWIYVYVKSENHLFVPEINLEMLYASVGYDTVIPCRPTSPDLNVTILRLSTNTIPEKVQSTFDPRVGFILKKPKLMDGDHYLCTATFNDTTFEEIYIYITVISAGEIDALKITAPSPRYLIRGQNLRINCTASLSLGSVYQMKWFGPSKQIISENDPRRPINNHTEYLRSGKVIHTAELNIFNLKDEDSGIYYCQVVTNGPRAETQTVIEVHDPNKKFINVSSDDLDRWHVLNETEKVKWVVHIKAHPPPTLRWMYSLGSNYMHTIYDGHELSSLSEYNVTNDQELTETIFSIKNLRLEHTGNYTLEASNERGNQTITFTLFVLMKPRNDFKVQAYYPPNQLVEIRNMVEGYPASHVTWSYLNCPNYPSRDDSYTENNLKRTLEEVSPIKIETKVNFIVKMTGILTCKACNELGCEEAQEVIFVSDGNNGFGIMKPEGQFTIGDDVEIICAASIYNYTNYFEWKLGDDVLKEDGRVRITNETTQFTYRSTLTLKNLQKSDKGEYTCIGKTNDYRNYNDYFVLSLVDPKPAEIYDTNLNRSEVIYDLNTLDKKTGIDLVCKVSGTPKPNITWYKDGVPIESNNQYAFFNNKQELSIKYLVDGDSGKYMCQAENRFKKEERYITFIVKGKNISLIWMIAVALLLIFCCILTIIFCIKMRRERIIRKELMEAGLTHFEEGALECLNPELTLDDQAELLPYDRKWEFPRERLVLGKQLGSGAFGVVRKAQARGIVEGEETTTVAVKMVKRTIDPSYIRALASELKIMVHLGKHLNVVNLLGACTKNITKRELLVIVEYCHFGNLHNYLLRHRGDFINQIDPVTGKLDFNIGYDILTETFSRDNENRIKYAALSFSRSLSHDSDNIQPGMESVTYTQDSQGVSLATGDFTMSNNSSQPDWRTNYRGDYKDKNVRPICTQDLISWAFQVARGMEYLSKRKVLHGDLAARNILMAENNVVKICDFGLAKTMYKDNNYKKKGDALLPIKWMAIESIRDRVFSTQSDVWSFGIVLWEFFTLAQTPYHGIDAETQYHKLIEGYRMEQPDNATKQVYDIMLRCWKAKPTLRPSFSELVNRIGDLLEESVKMHYVDLNTPYMDMNTMTLEGKNDYLTMMSAPDHEILSSPTREYVNSPSLASGPTDSAYLSMSPSGKDDSLIFSPGPDFNHTHFQFPSPTDNKSQLNSDSDENVESTPMLQEEDDPYLKPINIHAQRARFVKERKSIRDKPAEKSDPNLGYCNTPKFQSLDVKEKSDDIDGEKTNGKSIPPIIRTQDNYVNMPKQKSDLRRDVPDGFSNPSYIFIDKKDTDKVQI